MKNLWQKSLFATTVSMAHIVMDLVHPEIQRISGRHYTEDQRLFDGSLIRINVHKYQLMFKSQIGYEHYLST